MEISQSLQNAHSLDRVVELINGGGTSEFDSNELAAQYAYNAADEAGYGLDLDNLEAHLETLVENGAEFDQPAVLDILKEVKKH